jgi:hypothetical protein
MATSLKDDVLSVIDQLPQERLAEVLDFALFVKSRAQDNVSQRTVAQSVETLADAVALGADTIDDAARLYYGQH